MDGEPFNAALLEALARARGPSALRALTEALALTTGELQAAVVRALLARPERHARRELAAALPRLDAPARNALCSQPDALDALARQGIDASDPEARLAALDLLAEASRASTAYLPVSRLGDRDERVRARAAQVLRNLVQRHRDDEGAVRSHLAPAVSQAVRGYRHHQSADALQCAVLLGGRCPREVFEQIDSPAHRLGGALADAVRELPPDEAADFVFASLRYRRAGSVAQSYLAQAPWASLGLLGRRAHWLALTNVRRALATIHHLQAVADDPGGLADLPSAEQPGALRIILACGVAESLRATLLGLSLGGERPLAEVAMAIVLAERPDDAELVLLGLHSRHPNVQLMATGRLLAAGADAKLGQHLLSALPKLDEPVRTILGQFLAADGFEKYWRSYQRLQPPLQQAAGRALLKLDGSFTDLLLARLLGRDVRQQLQAVQVVRQLQLGDEFEPLLCRAARRGTKLVRAAAVSALSVCRGFEVRATLARALHDPDPRVQANAIESLAEHGGDPSPVMDKLHSTHGRVRANAVKWLLQTYHPQGSAALASMLADSRSAHRLSGLWVVRTLRHLPAVAMLERIALGDPDAKVRARAATILRQFRIPAIVESA